MDTLLNLVRAAVENRQEHTPVAMLADWLLEQDDGRGEILRLWLTGKNCGNKRGANYPLHSQSIKDDNYSRLATIYTHIWKAGFIPAYAITLEMAPGTLHPTKNRNRHFYVFVSLEDARLLADRIPGSEYAHSYLNTHFKPSVPNPPSG